MTEKTAETITQTINKMRAQNINDVEIALNFIGGAVPVLIEAAGCRHAWWEGQSSQILDIFVAVRFASLFFLAGIVKIGC